jgi:hypothetical protein
MSSEEMHKLEIVQIVITKSKLGFKVALMSRTATVDSLVYDSQRKIFDEIEYIITQLSIP